MRSDQGSENTGELRAYKPRRGLPQPTTAFRRRAWLQFQRAIDPLAPPKPLKLSRR